MKAKIASGVALCAFGITLAAASQTIAPPEEAVHALASRPEKPQLGLYRLVRKGETDALLRIVDESFAQVAESSARYSRVVPLAEPAENQGCGLEERCLAGLGGLQGADEVFAGTLRRTDNGLVLRARLVDARSEHVMGDRDQVLASDNAAEVRAWAESLACRLLLAQECLGVAVIDADLPEMKIYVDDQVVKRQGQGPERVELAVGAHRVRVAIDNRTSLERRLFVARDPGRSVTLYAREHEETISLETAREQLVGLDGRSAVAPSVRPRVERGWTRPVGLTVSALAIVAGGLAAYEGLHGRSLTNEANRSFAANGGAYQQSDLATISSAKNAATAGNVLLVSALLLGATGLTLTFAF